MFRFTCGFLTGVTFLVASASLTPAQPPPAPPSTSDWSKDYRQFFKKPETVKEFWDALQFEIEVGRFDLAAGHLKGLLKKSEQDPAGLAKLEENVGVAAFLRLEQIRKWSDDQNLDAAAKADAHALVSRVTAAVRARLGDIKRIDKFVKNLNASEAERDYALKELYQAGAEAIPRLIEEMRTLKGRERNAVFWALLRLKDDTIAPLIAALDIDDDQLRGDLISILRQRGAKQAIPNLLYYSALPKQPESIRQRAAVAAADLSYGVPFIPDGRLFANDALTKSQERDFVVTVQAGRSVAVGQGGADQRGRTLLSASGQILRS